jgi:outer membrane receptor protein involved in Fe transport
VDAEAKLTFLVWWYVSAGYNWLYAWDRSAETELFIQPAHTARLKVGFSHKPTGLHAYLQGRYFSEFPITLSGETTMHDPRFMLDLYVSRALGSHFTVNVGVDNLTGSIDETLGPFAAQRFSLGLTYTWK